MTRAAQPTFLAALHADRALQQALMQPEILDVAVRIARAAGFEVSRADLMAPPPERSPQNPEEGPAAEPLRIDFDGDGAPDAVLQGGRWVLLDSED
jgi:predicted ribosomally synthesized peptide with nif11-like leader